MIAMIALLATVLPNVGPTESLEGLGRRRTSSSSVVLDRCRPCSACQRSVEIWNAVAAELLVAVDLLDLRRRRSPAAAATSRTCVLGRPSASSAAVIRVPDSKSMPKFRPLPPIASAPISRITPDSEKNHFDAPMKSKRPARACCSPAPSALGCVISRELPHRAEDRLRRQHGGEQRDERADAEREGEALDAGGREHEQDERDHERDDVRVDDRREALLVARWRCPRRSICPPRISSLTRSKMTMFASAATPIVRIRPAMPGQRQRDRDQLDQREEVDRVDDQRADGDHAEHAVEDEQEERDDRRSRRGRRSGPGAAPACRASPRPATAEISSSLIGSAPVLQQVGEVSGPT